MTEACPKLLEEIIVITVKVCTRIINVKKEYGSAIVP